MQPIVYEPHPISPERKAELRAQGCRIIDAAFKPRETDPAGVQLPTREEIASMKRADVIEWLEAHGIEGPVGKLADLRAMLERAFYL